MHSPRVHRPTAVAMSRWVCSTATPPTIWGIGDPKQVGQSGQASPESVLVTSPPATMRMSVRKAAAAARRRTHIGRQAPQRAKGGAYLRAPPPSVQGQLRFTRSAEDEEAREEFRSKNFRASLPSALRGKRF